MARPLALRFNLRNDKKLAAFDHFRQCLAEEVPLVLRFDLALRVEQ